MPKVLDPKTNTEIELPDSVTAIQGIASGKYTAIPTETYVANLDGKPTALSGEEVMAGMPLGVISPRNRAAELVQAGQKPGKEFAESTAGKVAGVTFGALDTATFGGLSALSTEATREDQAEFERANPLLSGAASLAGAFLPGTPAGLLFKATRGMRSQAAAGAIEGTAFGAGQLVHDMQIHDAPLSASVLLGSAGAGAFLGGAAGMLQRRGKKMVDRAQKVELTRPEVLTNLDDSFAGLSSVKLGIADDVAKGVKTVDNDLLDVYQETYRNLTVKASEFFDDVSSFAPHATALRKLDEAVQEGNVAKVESAWKKVQSEADTFLVTTKKLKPTQTLALDDMNEFVRLRNRVRQLSKLDMVPSQAVKVGVKLDDAENALKKALGSKRLNSTAFTSMLKKGNTQQVIDVSKAYKNYLDQLVEAKNTYLRSSNKALIDRGVGLADQIDASTAKMAAAVRNAFPEGFDTTSVLAAGGAFLGSEAILPEFDGPADDLLKLGLASLLIKTKPRPRKGVSKALDTMAMSTATRGGGRTGQMVGGFRERMPGVGGEVLDAGAFALGGTVFRGIVNFATGRTRLAVASMRRKLGKTFMTGGKFLKKAGPVTAANVIGRTRFNLSDKKDPFERMQEEISLLATDANIDETITKGLQPVAIQHLGLADEMWDRLRTQLAFAYQTMPKDPGTLMVLGVSKWKPAPSELQRWQNSLIGIFHPEAVIDHLVAGRVTPEMAAAFRTVHPAYFAKLQEFFVENLPRIRQKADLRKRIAISLMFGVPTDPTMQMGMQLQDNFFDAAVENAQAGQPKPSNLKTRAQELTE